MSETAGRDAVHFKCEQCGREGGRAIFTCPERPSGHCPFVEQWREKKLTCLLVLVFPLGFVGLAMMLGLFLGGWGIPIPFNLLLLAAGLILGAIFLGIPRKKVLLYNANSGVRLQRTTLWGLELSCKWVTSGKPLPIDLELSQPLAYPPALTALPTKLHIVGMKQAIAILRTALIGLLAKGQIQVYHFRSYEFKTWGVRKPQDVYSIVATREFDQTRFKGRLEREIKRVLANWSKQEEAKGWPDGPPIYDLVRAIYGGDVDSPQRWLAQLVVGNAAAQGWGQIKETLRKRFELDATHTARLRSERAIVSELSSQLRRRQPDFSRALDHQIERAIRSRKFEPDSD